MPPKTRSSQGEILPASDLTGRRGHGRTQGSKNSVNNSVTSENVNEKLTTVSAPLSESYRQAEGSDVSPSQQLQTVPGSLEARGRGDAGSWDVGSYDQFQIPSEGHRSQGDGSAHHRELGRAGLLQGASERTLQ